MNPTFQGQLYKFTLDVELAQTNWLATQALIGACGIDMFRDGELTSGQRSCLQTNAPKVWKLFDRTDELFFTAPEAPAEGNNVSEAGEDAPEDESD